MRIAAKPGWPQPTVGALIFPSLNLQRINSKSLAHRLRRPDWADLTPWFCGMNPGRSGSPRARCSKFCSESAARFPLPIGADLWCSAPDCGICDCVSDIPCHRAKAAPVCRRRASSYTITAISASLLWQCIRRFCLPVRLRRRLRAETGHIGRGSLAIRRASASSR